jgi:hypothetical protein
VAVFTKVKSLMADVIGGNRQAGMRHADAVAP